jgi:hypothetical protein
LVNSLTKSLRRAIAAEIRSAIVCDVSSSLPNVSARIRICECGEWNPDATRVPD